MGHLFGSQSWGLGSTGSCLGSVPFCTASELGTADLEATTSSSRGRAVAMFVGWGKTIALPPPRVPPPFQYSLQPRRGGPGAGSHLPFSLPIPGPPGWGWARGYEAAPGFRGPPRTCTCTLVWTPRPTATLPGVSDGQGGSPASRRRWREGSGRPPGVTQPLPWAAFINNRAQEKL